MKKLPKTLTTVTWFSKFLATIMFFTFVLGGVYFGIRYQQMIDRGMIQPSENITPVKNAIIITPDQNNATLNAKVGEYISFRFNSNQKWTFTFSDTSLISGSGIDYKLIKTGTLTITGTGVADCKKGQICPMFAILFRVKIDIQP